MSEQATPEQQVGRLDPVLRLASNALDSPWLHAVGGVAAGTWLADRYTASPPTVELAPGIEVQASLTDKPGLISDFGPLAGELHLPNAPVHITGPLHEGIRIDPVTLRNPINDTDTLNNYLALVTHYDSTIAQPVRDAIMWRLVEGAGIGVVAGALTYLGLKKGIYHIKEYRRLRVKERAEQAEETDLQPEPSVVPPEKSKKKHFGLVRKSLAALAITGSLVGCGSVVYGNFKQVSNQEAQYSTLLPQEIQDMDPVFEGGTVSGPFRNVPRTAIDILIEKKKSTDAALQRRIHNFVPTYRTFVHENAQYRALRQDSDVKSILHESDFHCNKAFAEIMYGRLIEEVRPNIIADTGDIQVTQGSTPVEKDCFTMLTSRIGLIPFLYVGGNHDGKVDSDANVIDVGEEGVVNAQGINFVGVKDPEETKFTRTPDSEKARLNQEIAAQGQKLAELAQKVTEDTRGIRPIAMAHRWQVLSQAILEGNILLGNAGHTHTEGGVHQYQARNGTTVQQHTVGSLIGAKESITYYSDLVQDAYFMEELINTKTNTVVGYVMYKLNKETFETEITFIPPPTDIQEPTAMENFVAETSIK